MAELESRGGGGGLTSGEVDDGAPLVAEAGDAVQEDPVDSCEDLAEALAAENESLRARVAELESALAGVERRFELERALVDAGVVDLETALALAGARVEEGESVSAVVSGLASSKPFLFRAARPGGSGSALGGAAVTEGSSLSGLADEARRSGDRRALTRYLRKRRGG